MKKLISFSLLFLSIILLTWCSVETLREGLEEANQWLENSGTIDLWDISQYIWSNGASLDLSWLNLETIPDLCLLIPEELQSSIRAVNLSRNNIEKVDADLSCLENLVWIDLSFNNISELLGLWVLPELKDLRLSQNKIDYLSDKFFKAYPTLQSLRLSYNKLKEISALEDLKWLVNLELQHNELVSLVWLENMEKVEKIKLEFNELKEDQLLYIKLLPKLKSITWWYNNFKQELLDQWNNANE